MCQLSAAAVIASSLKQHASEALSAMRSHVLASHGQLEGTPEGCPCTVPSRRVATQTIAWMLGMRAVCNHASFSYACKSWLTPYQILV